MCNYNTCHNLRPNTIFRWYMENQFMTEKIFTLKACDGTLRKSFFKEIEPLKVGTWFVPTEYEINELKEIYELIKVKRDKKENYCFIRGNCDMDKIENEGWRRLKANTYDEAKHWA